MIDAYKIGVSIAVSSNGDQALGSLMRHLLGIHTAIDTATDKLKKLQIAAVGALSVGAGVGIFKGISDALKDAEKLNLQLERMKLTGVSAADVAAVRRTAFDVATQVPTTTPSDNVQVLNKLQTQLPNLTDASSVLADVQRLSYVIQVASGKDSDTSVESAIKFADLTGAVFSKGKDGKEQIDTAKFVHMMDIVEKAVTASGGLITPQSLVAFAKQAGLAIRGMSPDQIKYLGEVMIAMGPARAGTAETALLQQFAGGMMTQRVAAEMQRVGLLTAGEWTAARGGHVIVQPDATRRLATLALNPEQFATVIAEKLSAEGKSPVDIIAEITRLFGRQTTQRLAGELVTGAPQMQRFADLVNRVPDVGQNYAELVKNNLGTNVTSIGSAWTGLMQALGEPGIPMAIGVLHGLTDGVHDITNLMAAHPEMAHAMLDFAAGVGGILTLGGGMALTGVALGGLGSGIKLLAPAAKLFAAGEAGALGLGGLTLLLGGLAAVSAPFIAAKLGKFATDFDKGNPWAMRLDQWLGLMPAGNVGLPGSGSLPHRGEMVPFARPAPHVDAPGSSPSNPTYSHVTNQPTARQTANMVADQAARQSSRPQSGPTSPDPRSDGPYSGLFGLY